MPTAEIPEPVRMQLEQRGGLASLKGDLPSQAAIAAQARIYRALADPVRLAIVQLLSPDPLCVCILKEIIGIADSRLSYHLSLLQKAGLIEGRREGSWMIYSLTDVVRRYVMRGDVRDPEP